MGCIVGCSNVYQHALSLRGVDLNHRPLGYEPKGSTLSPVDFIAHPRSKLEENYQEEADSAR